MFFRVGCDSPLRPPCPRFPPSGLVPVAAQNVCHLICRLLPASLAGINWDEQIALRVGEFSTLSHMHLLQNIPADCLLDAAVSPCSDALRSMSLKLCQAPTTMLTPWSHSSSRYYILILKPKYLLSQNIKGIFSK